MDCITFQKLQNKIKELKTIIKEIDFLTDNKAIINIDGFNFSYNKKKKYYS